jgi:hypothetical protein
VGLCFPNGCKNYPGAKSASLQEPNQSAVSNLWLKLGQLAQSLDSYLGGNS